MGQLLVTLIVPPIVGLSPTSLFAAFGQETKMLPAKQSADGSPR
jgi:hypothetical protein